MSHLENLQKGVGMASNEPSLSTQGVGKSTDEPSRTFGAGDSPTEPTPLQD